MPRKITVLSFSVLVLLSVAHPAMAQDASDPNARTLTGCLQKDNDAKALHVSSRGRHVVACRKR